MSCEVEELQNIAISIMQDKSIGVIIDNTAETAYTDYKNLYVTIKLVPPELRKYTRVVSRILDGQVAHEAGHIVVTRPVKMRLMEWEKRQHNPSLADMVHQTIEDKRVNHFILQRYRFDFAHRLQLLADVSNRLWTDTLKMQLAKKRNENPANAMKPESYFLDEMIIAIAGIKGLWGVPVEKEFQLNEKQLEFVNKTAEILEEARFDKMVMSIVNRHQQLYNYWKTYVEQAGKSSRQGEHVPKNLGGDMELEAGQGTAKAIAKMEKNLKKQEQQAKEEAERERKRLEKDGKTMAAGSGTGLSIPTPVPNERAYERIVQRNREHIERLLNLLKRLAKPKLETEKWRKQGRFMTEVLGKAYASSLARKVDNVFSRKTYQLEKAEACMGLLVDLSGSVNEEDAKNTLAVISEVAGRWLRDEDFAIMVFGSDYQKIKAFVEPYHTTRIRIGGITCLGGTELRNPLDEMYKMLKSQHNGRTKILAIVSDFYVSRAEECKKLIKVIENDEISVIGLGIDSTNEQTIKQFCKRARYIGSIVELPEAFFDLYKEAAL